MVLSNFQLCDKIAVNHAGGTCMGDMKDLIREKYDQLSNVEKKVAKYVLDHYEESIMLSSVELAKAADTSNTAVIRYTKSLGFSGFIEYRRKIKEQHYPEQHVYDYLKKLERNNQDGNLVLNYLSSRITGLERYVKSLEIETLDEFCRTISQAETLYLAGVGSDEVVVHFLRNYLNVMGVKCIPVVEEGLALREKTFLMNEKDAILISAFPTLTSAELWVCKHAHSQGAKVLAITDSEVTAKQLGADCYAIVKDNLDTFFNSYLLSMAFCDALLLRYYELEKEQTTESIRKYHDIVEKPTEIL